MLVKMRKTTPMLTPSCWFPGKKPITPRITRGKNPRIGIDWNTSSKGIMIDSAFLFLAARIPIARLNMMLMTSATSNLLQEYKMSTATATKLKSVVGALLGRRELFY